MTGKARSEIRKFIRTQQRTEYINLGKAILSKTFKQEGEELSDKMLEDVAEKFNKKTPDDIYAEVGEGLINRIAVFEMLFPDRKAASQNKKGSLLSRLRKKQMTAFSTAMPIKGLIPGMAIHLGKCCHPIPGDKIVGIVTDWQAGHHDPYHFPVRNAGEFFPKPPNAGSMSRGIPVRGICSISPVSRLPCCTKPAGLPRLLMSSPRN